MDYPGKVITKTQVTPTQTSASGNWTLDDQAAAIKNNNWPVALVPNPISKSLRFNSADSAYLNRTPASATNQKTWTWSGWVKRSTLGVRQGVFTCSNSLGNDYVGLEFLANDKLAFDSNNTSASEQFRLETNAVFRDLSAWYHIVIFFNTTQATASNRAAIYINGVLQTYSTATYMPQNYDGRVNTTNQHSIGSWLPASGLYFNGYMTEMNFIDGQALTPSDFGLTNPQTGQWIPKKYTGTYGTNGFYLNFKDATSTTTLGYDYSGNANNWTTNNFSVTAGAGNDSLTDVPTPWVAYNTTGDVGGVVRGNYCTLNPLLFRYSVGAGTLTNGNLQATGSSTYFFSTFQMPATGKWYFEGVPTAGSSTPGIGLGGLESASSVFTNQVQYLNDGNKDVNGSQTSYGASYTTNDVIGVAVDCDAGTITFYKNNASQGAITTTVRNQFVFLQTGGSWTWVMNFGQRPFAYTPPAGFRSLCTTNLPPSDIGFGLTNQANQYFDVTTYTGNGAVRSVTNSGSMQPDFVWIKGRSQASGSGLFDVLRGTTKVITSNSNAQQVTDANSLTSFNSTGFSLGTDVTNNFVNVNTQTYVAWQWNAGGSNQTISVGQYATSPANVPSIASTVRANTTSGFSIATFNAGAAGNKTVGHGLGVAPNLWIVKGLSVALNSWSVGSSTLTTPASNYLVLNATSGSTSDTRIWANAAPTNNVFSFESGYTLPANSDCVAYCFAAVAGYSAFGSYVGNGAADGPFVYLGFRPAFVMVKNTASAATSNWIMKDDLRAASYNPATGNLYANLAVAEDVTATVEIDLLSNGFKVRGTYAGINGSTNSIIYMAFAESPFQFSNAR